MQAEIIGLLHGIQWCWEKGITKLVFYSNSLHALHLIEDCNQDFHVLGDEIDTIRNLLCGNWEIHLLHTLRECNQSANHLATLVSHGDEELIVLSSHPLELRTLLPVDASRESFVRN